MALVVDSENVVNSLEEAPDRLRAEIGKYYSPDSPGPFNFDNFRLGIKRDFLYEIQGNQQQLIPTRKARIFIAGEDQQFRDQIQWAEYVNNTIQTGRSFLDHQFNFTNPEIMNSMVKNFHHPSYEDATKVYDSNQLLNWNLVGYPFKEMHDTVSRIGDLRTEFDSQNYLVQSSSFPDLLDQFSNRISNYSGSIQEVSLKQRHIFDLQKPRIIDFDDMAPIVLNGPLVPLESFPYYYSKTLPHLGSTVPQQGRLFNQIIDLRKKRKNIFQSIKQDLSFSNRSFNVDGSDVSAKLYNFISLMTTTRIVGTMPQTNEIFLVPEQQIGFDDITSRFSDQINSVRFLSEMRAFIDNNNRKVGEIFSVQPSKTFFLGYKIEKFLDNDVGQPIQTYYTNDSNFYDTQLKYGRKYIYKTKLLIGILGSSYTYSNLFMSKNETQMVSEDGELAQSSPAGFTDISSEKYRAYVDVEATPSFQILEYQVDEDDVAFVDAPTLPPQVAFRNNSKKANVEFFFSPMFSRVEGVVEGSDQELMRSLVPLTEADENIKALLDISKDESVRPDYFTGIYEIYRMSSPPEKQEDFANFFLTSVDDKTGLAFPEGMGLPRSVLDNMNGHFEDFIVPNKKYYYAFRALTYHGTPSNLTSPFEVELLKDSDEYKINVSQYKYPVEKMHVYQKPAKRIIKVVPNIERLIFTLEEKTAAGVNFKLDEGNMLTKGQTTKFKIRVTSKHSGKKIDLNLNLTLKDETNSQ